ncbi:protein of unknown function [Bradyrhizobium vignae]|uniref:Uncharacterized protein n=1 Tax=Bradyrhizobium vignae TaxID=1549949 RepID=A0A2U3PV36_9BRAD|nr:protein of unknown function [Bradyrhizobium vignae]
MTKGACANIPPKSNRSDPIRFSLFLYRALSQLGRQRGIENSQKRQLFLYNSSDTFMVSAGLRFR